ncbi:hypothetical protein [Azospirillum endophyticum]
MGFGDTFKSAFAQATDAARSAAASVATGAEWIGNETAGAASHARDAAKGVAQWAGEQGEKAREHIKQKMVAAGGAIVDKARKAEATARQTLESARQTLQSEVAQAQARAAQGLSAAQDKARQLATAAQSQARDIAERTRQEAANMARAAQQKAEQFVEAARQKAGEAYQAAQKTAEAAMTQARQEMDRARAEAQKAADALRAKAADAAGKAKQAFRAAARTAEDKAVGAAHVACSAAKKGMDAVRARYNQGLQNSESKKLANPDGKWKVEGKRGAEYDGRNYSGYGSESSGVPGVAPKAEMKVARTTENELLYYGSDDNNVRVGVNDDTLALGYEHDFENNRDILGVVAEKQVAVATAQGKHKFGEGAEVSGQVEAISAKAGGTFAMVRSADFVGAKAEVGAEANLVKGAVGGQINITPRTVYANTLGKVVGAFKPEWKELPSNKYTTKGIFVGGGLEAGIGAAAKANAEVNLKKASVDVGAKLGAGPMAGLSATFGLILD